MLSLNFVTFPEIYLGKSGKKTIKPYKVLNHSTFTTGT